jgi:subtilisin family serine protease
MLVSITAMAQTVRLDANGKSDASTQVALRKASRQTKAGVNKEIRMLAKVSKHFDAQKLKAQGIVVGSQAGDIVTLRLSPDKAALLDENADILQYSVAFDVFPTMNRTRTDTRTDSVQAGLGLPQAYTGEGVIVGITDWGFDYTNPNYNNNGESNRRLLRAWDQFRLAGPAPEGFDYGTEIDNRHDLLQAKCDTFGLYGYATHGTHVAGISAGRGIDGNYTGQAPYANLLFASFHLNGAAWIDAVNWMKNVAKEEGKRLVINNSWGMYTLGPIDGTSLVSQAINNLSDSGIVFVTSGGNCGDDKFHLSKTFVPGTSDTLRSLAKYYGSQEIGQAIIMWGEPGKSFTGSFAMVNGEDSACFRWVNTTDGSFYLDSALTCGNDTLPFDITVESANTFNDRPHIQINVAKNRNYEIHIAVTAEEGTVHVWNMTNLANGAGNMGAEFTRGRSLAYTKGDNACGIGEPACAESCITVAAHAADRTRPNGELEAGILADFSSKGPVIDGRRKPDISAPGTDVVSSINYYTTEVYTAVMTYSYVNRQYIWARMSGTSMSCPAVTGIVALMLEANPNMSPRHVREILCRTSRNDEQTGPLHERDSMSDAWGWGKVNALAAVNEALAHVDINNADEKWFAKSLQLYPNPAESQVTVLTGSHSPERVTVYSIDGRTIMTKEVVMEGTLDVARLPHGVYIVKCGARTARLVH